MTLGRTPHCKEELFPLAPQMSVLFPILGSGSSIKKNSSALPHVPTPAPSTKQGLVYHRGSRKAPEAFWILTAGGSLNLPSGNTIVDTVSLPGP